MISDSATGKCRLSLRSQGVAATPSNGPLYHSVRAGGPQTMIAVGVPGKSRTRALAGRNRALCPLSYRDVAPPGGVEPPQSRFVVSTPGPLAGVCYRNRVKNLAAPIKSVKHADLERWGDSAYKSCCPECGGLLFVRRNQKTLRLERHDRCVRCAQRFVYTDDSIGAEELPAVN